MKDSMVLTEQQKKPGDKPALVLTSKIFARPASSNVNHFPQLLVLDKMVDRLKATGQLPNLENTIFIGVQHLLKTTGTLFETLIRLGAKPSNMYFAGKCYSTSPEVADKLRSSLGMRIINGTKPERWGEYKAVHNQDIKQLWSLCEADIIKTNKKIDQIIVVDDGAGAIENIPSFFTNREFKIVCIEQTSFGVRSKIEQTPETPVIILARSAAKKKLEPKFIQAAVLNKLEPTIQSISKFNIRIGIVGLGSIGTALMTHLLNEGYTLLVYDRKPEMMQQLPLAPNLKKAPSLDAVLLHSDYTFGCTGSDITAGINLLQINGRDRTLISCSSGCEEFPSLLNAISDAQPKAATILTNTLEDVEVKTASNSKICIKKGGFPANFDTSGTSVPDEEIALTRGLILGAILQAVQMVKANDLAPNEVMLDPAIQRYVALLWQATLDPKKTAQLPLNEFHDLNQIVQDSQGKPLRVIPDNPFFIPEASARPSRTLSKL